MCRISIFLLGHLHYFLHFFFSFMENLFKKHPLHARKLVIPASNQLGLSKDTYQMTGLCSNYFSKYKLPRVGISSRDLLYFKQVFVKGFVEDILMNIQTSKHLPGVKVCLCFKTIQFSQLLFIFLL